MWGSKPMLWSLAIKGRWGTVSNTFLKSKNTAPISMWLSSWRNQSCVHSINADTVDFPCWNPHWQLERGWFSMRWLLIKLKKWRSKTLLITGRSEIGLKSEEYSALVFLGIGTTEEVFHPEGGCPHRIEQLRSLVMEGAIAPAVCFSIRPEMPSGPLDLVESKI